MEQVSPKLEEFLSYCKESLKFLEDFGFKEIPSPLHRSNNPFQLWFKADKRNVIISGEGWGTSASIYLEHDDGFELAEIYLIPQDKRPKLQKGKGITLTQLEQISRSANWLKDYGRDFLEGDLERFFQYARPLPSYKLPHQ
jgi:hypothetical protein